MGIGFWRRAKRGDSTGTPQRRAGNALLASSARLAVLDDQINDLLALIRNENRPMTEQERLLLEELNDEQRATLQRLEADNKRFRSFEKRQPKD